MTIPHNEDHCSTCVYYSPPIKGADTPSEEGHCRRFPPSFRTKGAKVGDVAQWEANSAFPGVIPAAWCGEHIRRIEQ